MLSWKLGCCLNHPCSSACLLQLVMFDSCLSRFVWSILKKWITSWHAAGARSKSTAVTQTHLQRAHGIEVLEKELQLRHGRHSILPPKSPRHKNGKRNKLWYLVHCCPATFPTIKKTEQTRQQTDGSKSNSQCVSGKTAPVCLFRGTPAETSRLKEYFRQHA